MEMVGVKTDELAGKELDYAYLIAMHGDGPDWKVVDGVFGIVYLENVRLGFDGIGEQEKFQPFLPRQLYGDDACRSIVHAKLGETVLVPKELVK